MSVTVTPTFLQLSTTPGAIMTNATAGETHLVANKGITALIVSVGEVVTSVTIAKQVSPRPGDRSYPDIAVSDLVSSIGPNETRIFPVLPRAFNDATGSLQVTFDQVDGVTIGAIRLQ